MHSRNNGAFALEILYAIEHVALLRTEYGLARGEARAWGRIIDLSEEYGPVRVWKRSRVNKVKPSKKGYRLAWEKVSRVSKDNAELCCKEMSMLTAINGLR